MPVFPLWLYVGITTQTLIYQLAPWDRSMDIKYDVTIFILPTDVVIGAILAQLAVPEMTKSM